MSRFLYSLRIYGLSGTVFGLSLLSLAGCSNNIPRDNYVVFFERDSVTLTPEAEEIVRSAANAIERRREHHVIVSGSAGVRGQADILRQLAGERARAVADLLRQDGVPETYITVMPYVPSAMEDSLVALRRVNIQLGTN